MLWIIVFVVTAGLAFIPAQVAGNKGGDKFVWWIYGFFLFPFALIHALLWKPPREVTEARAIDAGDYRRCPHCAELARREATVCPHCRNAIEPLPPRPVARPADEPAQGIDGLIWIAGGVCLVALVLALVSA